MKYSYIVLVCALNILLNSCSHSISINGIYRDKYSHEFIFFPDSTFVYKSMLRDTYVNRYSDGKWIRIDKNTIVLKSRITNNIIPLQVEKMTTKDSRIQICENLVIIQNRSRYEYENKDFLVTPYIEENNYLDLHPELSDEPLQITNNDLRISIGLEPDTTNLSKMVMTNPPIKRGSYCIYLDKPFNSLYFKIEKRPKTIIKTGISPTYYTLQTEKLDIPVYLGELIKVNICLNDSLFSYKIFDNTKLKIRGNKLVFKDTEKNNKVNKLYLKK